MKDKIFAVFLLPLLFVLTVTQSEAQVSTNSSPSDQLQQLTAQLQNSPDDTALRGRIIALAQTIVPAPALTDEANRRMARGTEAFKEAKSTADYQDAVKEFQQATLAAPWSGDAYFNLGLAQDKAEDFTGSLASLKLAQLASPDSKDIKDLYYKVEYQRDKAAEQNSAAAKGQRAAAEEEQKAAEQEKAEQDRIAALNGAVWRFAGYHGDWSYEILCKGNKLILTRIILNASAMPGSYTGERQPFESMTLIGRTFDVPIESADRNRKGHGIISDDGRIVTISFNDKWDLVLTR